MRVIYDSTDSSAHSQPPADDKFVFLRLLFFGSSQITFWWLCDLHLFVWVFLPSRDVQYVQLIIDRLQSVLLIPLLVSGF